MQRIMTPKQRQKLMARGRLKELMSAPRWVDKQAIMDHIDKNITTLARARALMKEMAAILIQIRRSL